MLGMLSTFKYHQAPCVRSHPSTHTQIEYMITVKSLIKNLSLLVSSDSPLTVLTVYLDVIAATYKCSPPHINLSMSLS